MAYDISDYVAVNDRVLEFWKRYPNGAIATGKPEPVPGRPDLLMVQAIVYRDPEDRVPVTAWATEYAEGKTSFTRGREVENASTSAVGRALGYYGIGIKKGMASLNEVVEQEARENAPEKPKTAPVRRSEAPQAPEVDPWAVEAPAAPFDPAEFGLTLVEDNPDAPMCEHGARTWKTGTSKAGKPWSAWMCTAPKSEACEPLWR